MFCVGVFDPSFQKMALYHMSYVEYPEIWNKFGRWDVFLEFTMIDRIELFEERRGINEGKHGNG